MVDGMTNDISEVEEFMALSLVAHVGDKSPTCKQQPTMSAKFCQQGNVATPTYFFCRSRAKKCREMPTFHKYTIVLHYNYLPAN
jgi:hypothetical protein